MQTYRVPEVIHRHGLEPPRVLCTRCEHAEFVHGDFDPRLCLYTECVCAGFIRAETD
jgi:hypothetical protein